MNDTERFLRQTLELAKSARAKGNHPFGALLVIDGDVVLTAENEVVTERDATRHAELVLVSEAGRTLPPADLGRATLYTSTEPCPMCAAAIYWTGIRAVVYACAGETLALLAGESFAMPCREIFARGREDTSVTGPLLAEEAVAVHTGFWRKD